MKTPQVILEKIEKLKHLDSKLEVFGARGHHYVSTLLPEADIIAFEKQYQCTLPEEYRQFLIEVGTGTGPDYGLITLTEAVEELERWKRRASCWDDVPNPGGVFSQLCMLTNEDAQLSITGYKQTPKEGKNVDLTCLDGILPIADGGCSGFNFMVINGEQRSKIWEINLDVDPYFCGPAHTVEWIAVYEPDRLKEYTFLEWYEDWLDTSFKKLHRTS